jgi:hypothetical protein
MMSDEIHQTVAVTARASARLGPIAFVRTLSTYLILRRGAPIPDPLARPAPGRYLSRPGGVGGCTTRRPRPCSAEWHSEFGDNAAQP